MRLNTQDGSRGIKRLLPFVLLIAFSAPLVAHAAVGSTMRYSGDDYCYAGTYQRHGLFGNVWISYIEPAPFNGNRFSLTLASGLADAVGPLASAWLPGLVLVTWLIGIAIALDQLLKALGVTSTRIELALGTVVLTFAAIDALPDPIQTLYWRSAMLPYLAPLVLLPLLLALGLSESHRTTARKSVLIGAFALAFSAAGFSETAAVLQLAALAILAFAVLRLPPSMSGRFPSANRMLLAAGTGTLLAIALLILAPGQSGAVQAMWESFDPVEVLRITFENLYLFGYAFFLRHTWTLGVAFLVFLWLGAGVLARRDPLPSPTWRKQLGIAVVVGLIALTLAIASLLPSALALSGFPPGRVLTGATFVGVTGVAAAGILAGFAAVRLFEGRLHRVRIAFTLLTAAAAVYALLSARSVLGDLPRYQRWAEFWDQRHAQILAARSRGERSVEVVLIDHIIPDVAELQPDPDYWYNNCAEWYYDLRSLSANQPGWDD